MDRILVIDDDAILRTSLRLTLEKADYRVCEAGDGGTAMRLVETLLLDLVICDLGLPGPGGLEIICHLRKHHPEVPVLAISASGIDEGFDPLESAVRFGAARSLRKPFELQVVLSAARELLAARKGRRRAARRGKPLVDV